MTWYAFGLGGYKLHVSGAGPVISSVSIDDKSLGGHICLLEGTSWATGIQQWKSLFAS